MKKSILLLLCFFMFFPSLFSNKSDDNKERYESSTFDIGVGFGNSYGLLGIRGQYITPGSLFRGGIHGGVGFFPGYDYIHLSIGGKFFIRDLYLSAQYSVLDYFELTIEYGAGSVTSEPHPVYGAGIMVGFDTSFEKFFKALGILPDKRPVFPNPTGPRSSLFFNNSNLPSAKNKSNNVELGINIGAGIGIPEIEPYKILPLIDIGITLSF